MRKLRNMMVSALLVLTFVLSSITSVFAASIAIPYSVDMLVNGKAYTLNGFTIDGYNFFALRDFAVALSESNKKFDIAYGEDNKSINLLTKTAYTATGTEMQALAEADKSAESFGKTVYVDGTKVIYTAFKVEDVDYFRMVDMMHILDVYAVYNEEKDAVEVNTRKPFSFDMERTIESGYFDFLHAALLGNADTGEIIFSVNQDHKVSIASTSKVMTYLLIKEALEKGEIALDDQVVLSELAEWNSLSEDGVIPMKAGETALLSELIEGMMVVSSNESALALGEHLAGSEEAFVEMMNARAAELGLTSAEFYNSHGLPTYTKDVLASKVQNRMSAEDLFTLCNYVLGEYPELLDITKQRNIELPSLDFTGENTNRVLFQMAGVDGLKTGTTNRAGTCLIATMPVQNGEETTRVIAIVLGAEDSKERGEKTAMLLEYAKQYYAELNQ